MANPDRVRLSQQERGTIQQFQFPEKLGDHAVLLHFKEYSYNQRGSKKADKSIVSSILLPLPEQLLDAAGVKIAGVQLGAMGAAAAAASASSGNSFEEIGAKLTDKGNIQTVLDISISLLLKEGLNAVGAQGAQKGIEAGMGTTLNPFQALTFEGVDLKSYTFDWTFAPTSRTETDALQKILKKMRWHIHPKYKSFSIDGSDFAESASKQQGGQSGRAFLSYPDVCHVTILGSPDGSLITFKPAIVGGLQINYAGGGETAFLEGGAPAAVKVSMNLTEMQIWTREDYK
jgi:hypothetical protein